MERHNFYDAHRWLMNKFSRLWHRISISATIAILALWLLIQPDFWLHLFDPPFAFLGVIFSFLLATLIYVSIHTLGITIKEGLVTRKLRNRYKVILLLILLALPAMPGSLTPTQKGLLIVIEPVTRYSKLDTMGINSEYYLQVLGERESRNNYRAIEKVNRKHLGKYQFSIQTLKGLRVRGYLTITDKEIQNFLEHPEVQERAMDALIVCNNDYFLKKGSYKYLNKKIGGVVVTKEGMLAAAHLVGPFAVNHFLKTGSLEPVTYKGRVIRKKDGNGVALTRYMGLFKDNKQIKTMSWTVSLIGTPAKIVEKLDSISASMGEGYSKQEFDAATPGIKTLVNQNFITSGEKVVVHLEANGYGYHNNEGQIEGSCNVSIKRLNGALL